MDDFVRRWQAAWGRPDPDAIAALADPDIRISWPGLAEPITGAREWRTRVAGTLARFPDVRFEVVDHAVGERATYISWRAGATVGGEPLRWQGVDRMRLRDGRVTEATVVFDTAPFIR